jgi:hypothetical protein
MIDTRTKFVAISVYTVAQEHLGALQASARASMEENIASLEGFREGTVMTDENQTQVLIVTSWDSKNAWIDAHWEPRIGKAVADFVTDASAYDVRTYVPVTIVRSA